MGRSVRHVSFPKFPFLHSYPAQQNQRFSHAVFALLPTWGHLGLPVPHGPNLISLLHDTPSTFLRCCTRGGPLALPRAGTASCGSRTSRTLLRSFSWRTAVTTAGCGSPRCVLHVHDSISSSQQLVMLAMWIECEQHGGGCLLWAMIGVPSSANRQCGRLSCLLRGAYAHFTREP